MSYTKSLGKYPPSFAQLIEAACVKPVLIPLTDPKEIARLRGRLYNYIAAVGRAKAEVPELARAADRVQLVVTSEGLLAQPRDLDKDNLLLQAALGGEPIPDVGPQPGSVLAALAVQDLTNDGNVR